MLLQIVEIIPTEGSSNACNSVTLVGQQCRLAIFASDCDKCKTVWLLWSFKNGLLVWSWL